MNFKKTALAIALFGTVASAQAAPMWNAYENIAITSFSNGVSIFVGFSQHHDCDVALLGIGGNNAITDMSMIVGSTVYTSSNVTQGESASMVLLSEEALRALKSSQKATIVTAHGVLEIDLTGSSNAFNRAYRGCLSMISKQRTGTIQPNIVSF